MFRPSQIGKIEHVGPLGSNTTYSSLDQRGTNLAELVRFPNKISETFSSFLVQNLIFICCRLCHIVTIATHKLLLSNDYA